VEITYEVIMGIVKFMLYICAIIMLVAGIFAKDDISKINYNVELLVCYILAQGI